MHFDAEPRMGIGPFVAWHRCRSLRWRSLAEGRALVPSHSREGRLIPWCGGIVEGGLANGTSVARSGSLDACVGQAWPSIHCLPADLTWTRKDASPLNASINGP